MVVWHSFLPFGLSIAICVFVSWKSVESQLELRNDGSRRGIGEGLDDDDDGDDDEGAAANAAAPSRHHHRRRDHHHRPPRTASELRARLHTLARMAPGPRRLARGRALALAAERALREASPQAEGGGAGGESGDCGGEPVVVESNAAAALRQTLPWLDARLAALACEDARAERCGPCEICAGFDDARATHAWPCGGQRREGGGGEGGGNGGQSCGGGGVGGVGGLLAAIFGNSPPSSSNSSSSSCSPASPSSDSHSVYTTSRHRACGRCSAKCGAKCPWCRREEGAPRLAFLELCGGGGGA